MAGRAFEFALVRDDALLRPVDPTAFASHFDHDQVVCFENLGGDAAMVAPCPIADKSSYGHLAAFVRGAPPDQVHRLWQEIGDAMQRRMSDAPVWLSTAGLGVAWLHVRLDSRPKYYAYGPYTRGARGTPRISRNRVRP